MKRVVIIAGVSSNIGKTTLLCDLLGFYPGWEAIKVSRGHYRSCGKDPQACCVSHLLGENPVLLSGRADTYKAGKDTGRYWECGASNVHWLICTGDQVRLGINLALERVEADGVFIEGTSVLGHVDADFSIIVADSPVREIKSSALRTMNGVDAIYAGRAPDASAVLQDLRGRMKAKGREVRDLTVYTAADLGQLVCRIGAAVNRTEGRSG